MKLLGICYSGCTVNLTQKGYKFRALRLFCVGTIMMLSMSKPKITRLMQVWQKTTNKSRLSFNHSLLHKSIEINDQ